MRENSFAMSLGIVPQGQPLLSRGGRLGHSWIAGAYLPATRNDAEGVAEGEHEADKTVLHPVPGNPLALKKRSDVNANLLVHV